MSTSYPQPDASATEELVAYLDGELSAEECRRVERRLADDAGYRQQLAGLEQAWTALEALPPTVVDDDFAQTTIEMVAVAEEGDASARSAAQSTQRRRRAYWVAAAGLALAAAGFTAARILLPGANDLLIRDLPVIVQLDVLTQVEDIDYLRGLAKLRIEPFDEGEGGGVRSAAQLVSTTVGRSPHDRRMWIERLPADDRTELAAKLDRFAKLSPAPEAQDRLRRLEHDIADAPDRAELEETLASYADWIQRRAPVEQLELRELPTAKRLRRVETLLRDAERQAGWQLSLEDERALQEAILEFVAERRDRFEREIDRRGNSEDIRQHPTARVALAIIGWQMRDDDQRRRLHDRLTAPLSSEAQEYFDELDGRQRWRQLRSWVYAALQPKLGPQELERFFTEELTSNQREYLLTLPLPDMEEQLQEWYLNSQVGLRNREWGGDFDRSGRGSRGPNRGPGERGRRDGPRRDFEGGRFERGPFPPGPGGPPPEGRPPGRDWRPPPNGGPPPRDSGPPPEEPI